MNDSSPGSSHTVSNNGWSNNQVFIKFLNEHFLPNIVRPIDENQKILLLFDGHKSHICPDVRRWAVENKIILFLLPPHSSHKLQPLDVSCFGPLKKYYKKVCFTMMHVMAFYKLLLIINAVQCVLYILHKYEWVCRCTYQFRKLQHTCGPILVRLSIGIILLLLCARHITRHSNHQPYTMDSEHLGCILLTHLWLRSRILLQVHCYKQGREAPACIGLWKL